MYKLPVLIALLALGDVGLQDINPRTVHYLSIACIDCSGSMGGFWSSKTRLGTAQKELLNFLDELPPSPKYPFVLITFTSRASSALVFTSPEEARNAVQRLRAGGGTSIASGLREVHRVLALLPSVPKSLIMLYSDGADSDQRAIRAEETKLESIFLRRKDKGLGNRVVLKRWGGANAQIERSLQNMDGVIVTDAETLAIKPIKFDSELSVLNARRSKDDSTMLDVELEATLNATAPASFACRDDKVQGDTTFELDPGETKKLSVRIPLRADGLDPASIDVPYKVTAKDEPVSNGNEILIPILPDAVASVPLPDLKIVSRTTATLENNGRIEWLDVLAGTIRVPVKLTITRRDLDQAAQTTAASVLVTPDNGRIIKGETSITIDGPGTRELPLVFALSPAQDDTYDLAFTVELASLSPLLIIQEPSDLHFSRNSLQPPPPIRVPVRLTATASKASWLRIPNISLVGSRVVVHADGPFPPQSTIRFDRSSQILRIAADTKTLKSNDQALRLRMACSNLAPHPKATELGVPYSIESSLPKRIVLVPTPLTTAATGPGVLQLVNASANDPAYRARILDTVTEIRIPVRPMLRNVDPRAVSPVPVDVLIGDKKLATVHLNKPGLVAIPISKENQPFFQNRKMHIDIRLRATIPGVRSTQDRVEVFQYAPVLRIVMYTAFGVVCCGGIVLLLIVVHKFRTTEELTFTKQQEGVAA